LGLWAANNAGSTTPGSFRLTGSERAAQSRNMLNPVIQALLILQDRDMKRLGIEAQLKAIPGDIARVEQKIAAEKAAIDLARTEMRDLEVKKKGLENEIGSAEQKVGQYRTQQLSIRKNEEYQAMGHQIETTLAQIAELEGKELELMYAIDEAKKKFAAAEAELKANISGHEARIKTLRDRAASLTEELKSVQAEVATARTPVGESRLRVYDRIVTRNVPAVVAIHAGKCGGCHLKVSSEVESAARGKNADPVAQLPTCDQCGRIVYWEA
jgi:predicted  nucleic acid-binding Zn-ribbon protein